MSLNPVSDADAAKTNAFYRALSAGCRRRALRWLAAHDPVPPAVLAKSLAGDETDVDAGTVRLQLVHAHVPKLVEADLVRRTGGDELLTATARGEAAVEFVDSWSGSAVTRSED